MWINTKINYIMIKTQYVNRFRCKSRLLSGAILIIHVGLRLIAFNTIRIWYTCINCKISIRYICITCFVQPD